MVSTIQSTNDHKNISVEECLGDVSEFVFECERLGVYPSSVEYSKFASLNGLVCYKTLRSKIDSEWSEILKTAGFELAEFYSDSSITSCLGDVAAFVFECERICVNPTSTKYSRYAQLNGFVTVKTLLSKIDPTWSGILKSAGFDLTEFKDQNPVITYLGDVSEFVFECERLGIKPSHNKYTEFARLNGLVCYETLRSKIAPNWNEILKAAGFDLTEFKDQVLVRKYLGDVSEFVFECERLGVYPSSGEYYKFARLNGLVCDFTLRSKIASNWSEILKAAGFDPKELKDQVLVRKHLGDVSEFVFECERLGVYPSSDEYSKFARLNGLVSYTTLQSTIDNKWSEILKAVGYKKNNV